MSEQPPLFTVETWPANPDGSLEWTVLTRHGTRLFSGTSQRLDSVEADSRQAIKAWLNRERIQRLEVVEAAPIGRWQVDEARTDVHGLAESVCVAVSKVLRGLAPRPSIEPRAVLSAVATLASDLAGLAEPMAARVAQLRDLGIGKEWKVKTDCGRVLGKGNGWTRKEADNEWSLHYRACPDCPKRTSPDLEGPTLGRDAG